MAAPAREITKSRSRSLWLNTCIAVCEWAEHNGDRFMTSFRWATISTEMFTTDLEPIYGIARVPKGHPRLERCLFYFMHRLPGG